MDHVTRSVVAVIFIKPVCLIPNNFPIVGMSVFCAPMDEVHLLEPQ